MMKNKLKRYNDFINESTYSKVDNTLIDDQELVKMEIDMNKFIDSLTNIELLSLFCHCNEMEFGGEPGLVHPGCKCNIKKGIFITNEACDICNEARDAWNNSGSFMNVFGNIYSKKDFGEKASIGFNKTIKI